MGRKILTLALILVPGAYIGTAIFITYRNYGHAIPLSQELSLRGWTQLALAAGLVVWGLVRAAQDRRERLENRPKLADDR